MRADNYVSTCVNVLISGFRLYILKPVAVLCAAVAAQQHIALDTADLIHISVGDHNLHIKEVIEELL